MRVVGGKSLDSVCSKVMQQQEAIIKAWFLQLTSSPSLAEVIMTFIVNAWNEINVGFNDTLVSPGTYRCQQRSSRWMTDYNEKRISTYMYVNVSRQRWLPRGRFEPATDCATTTALYRGSKTTTEQFTAFLVASAIGEKLKPQVIGKPDNPRCSRMIEMSLLPCSDLQSLQKGLDRAI